MSTRALAVPKSFSTTKMDTGAGKFLVRMRLCCSDAVNCRVLSPLMPDVTTAGCFPAVAITKLFAFPDRSVHVATGPVVGLRTDSGPTHARMPVTAENLHHGPDADHWLLVWHVAVMLPVSV